MKEFLAKCLEIEKTAARIYDHFQQTIDCPDELKRIWVRMALDEEAHAEQVKLAMRLAEEGAFSGKRVAEGKVDQLINRVRSIVAGIEKQKTAIGDALRVSMKLEEDFGQVHAVAALDFVDTGMEEVFKRLARADEEHVKELNNYYRKHFSTR